jgi:phosphatidylglycerol lysyltransferase
MTEHVKLKELLTRFGRNVHSFQVLEPGLRYWYSAEREGAVAYVDQGGHWVTVGAPLGAEKDRRDLCVEFQQTAEMNGKKVAFFGVSERFLEGFEEGEFDALKIAEQPIWNPREWPTSLQRNQKLRNRINRCRREGVQVQIVSGDALDRSEVSTLQRTWEDGHRLPPMQFMVQMDLFGQWESRFYVAARKQGRLVGLAVGVPIYGLDGWLLEDLIVDRFASHGIGEALVDGFMKEAARRDARMVSLGMVALAGLGGLENHDHPFLDVLMSLSRSCLKWLYNADGLRRFRQKMSPAKWESVYLVTPKSVDLWAMRAVLMAFAGGWVPKYAWRTLKRVTCPTGRACCS